MAAPTTPSLDERLESLVRSYRETSTAHIQAIWEEFAGDHPPSRYPSSKTLRANARLLLAGKRYRYALALAGYRLLSGNKPSSSLERAATWLEFYHLYTLFLDDIMDEDERRRTMPSAWSTNAKLYRAPGATEPAVVFRTRRHRYGVSQAILDSLRIRSLAERAIQGAEELDSGVRVALLSELTDVDLVLSDGQGLDIDFEHASRVPEEDYVRMSEAKTARLYLGAAATAAIVARASAEERQALEEYALRFAIAFQDRDDLLGSGVVSSRIGGSSEGDIRQGKRTRLYVLATQLLRARNKAAFLGAYGRGPRTTRRDVATVRGLLRNHVLPVMEARIQENLRLARESLNRIQARDADARDLLLALLDVQSTRVR